MNAAPKFAHTVTLGPFFQDVATFTTGLEGLPSEKVQEVVCTPDGTVYAGTENGLARFAAGSWEPLRS